MAQYVIRRLLLTIPTLIAISFIVFALLDLAPGDPTSQVPLTVPAEVREQIRESLGFNDPFLVRYWNWAQQLVINEPIHLVESVTGACLGDCEGRERIFSWSSRSPAMDTVYQRLPQTLWVLGLGLVFGVLIAIPIGTLQARKQYSWFDNTGTFVTMLGFSVPVFVFGPMMIFGLLGHSRVATDRLLDHPRRRVDELEFDLVPDQTADHARHDADAVQRGEPSVGSLVRRFSTNLNEGYVRTALSKGVKERPGGDPSRTCATASSRS